jgi:hypothetical protein
LIEEASDSGREVKILRAGFTLHKLRTCLLGSQQAGGRALALSYKVKPTLLFRALYDQTPHHIILVIYQ